MYHMLFDCWDTTKGGGNLCHMCGAGVRAFILVQAVYLVVDQHVHSNSVAGADR